MIRDIDLNKPSALPDSSASVDGASGGALGDASIADLDKGFTSIKPNEVRGGMLTDGDGDEDCCQMPEESTAGFLNRPAGWER